MKTTLEIPDGVFRRAKARAAEQNIPLCRFVSDAVADKLQANAPSRRNARRVLAGRLRHLRKETARVDALIEREFERIEPEEWA